jgi:hypothetical protein
MGLAGEDSVAGLLHLFMALYLLLHDAENLAKRDHSAEEIFKTAYTGIRYFGFFMAQYRPRHSATFTHNPRTPSFEKESCLLLE